MKKLLKIVLALSMVLALCSCSKKEETTPTVDGGEGEDQLKIAILIPYRGDQSYFDTIAKTGDAENAKDNGVSVTIIEADKDGKAEAENWANWYANVCEDADYDIIISGNQTYEGFLNTAALKYPDKKFINFDTTTTPDPIPANLYAVDYALDDLGYVVGALSAAVSKTGVVGAVVGMDNQAMNQFISGYCQVLTEKGVQYIIDYPGSFVDTALGKEHTEAMIQKGADVIWQVAGGLGNGVIEACSNHDDVWCIGVDQDQHAQFAASQPAWSDTILTSALKKSDSMLAKIIEWSKDGTMDSKWGTREQFGLALDGVGLAENDYYLANVSQDIRDEIAATLAKAASGEIEVMDCLTWDDETYAKKWPELLNGGRLQ